MITELASESAELRKLDLMFTLGETSATTSLIRNIKSILPNTRHYTPATKHSLVSYEFLPRDPSDSHYLYFHIDQNDDDKLAKAFFCHFVFSVQPKTPPPQDVTDRHASGLTLDWFIEKLRDAIGAGVETAVAVDAELRLKGWRNPRTSPPLQISANTLESCGAEYHSIGRTTTGVHKFRWSNAKAGHTNVWLSYDATCAWKQPWHEEKERCVAFLRNLM